MKCLENNPHLRIDFFGAGQGLDGEELLDPRTAPHMCDYYCHGREVCYR